MSERWTDPRQRMLKAGRIIYITTLAPSSIARFAIFRRAVPASWCPVRWGCRRNSIWWWRALADIAPCRGGGPIASAWNSS